MLNKLKKELIKYGAIAGQKCYTPGISGNLSCRYEDNVLITVTGSSNGFLADDELCLIDMSGNLVEGTKKPSTEKFLHLEFYKQRQDINCIFHVHSPYLTAFASSDTELNEMVSPEIIYCFDKIVKAEYALPGSVQLVQNTAKYFKDNDIVLMKNHGVIIGGSDIKQAYLKLELLEEYAKTIIFTKILGGANILSNSEVEKIYSLKRGK